MSKLFLINLLICLSYAQELFSKSEICEIRPSKCNLVCPFGYLKSNSKCVCACALDPCQTKECQMNETCVTSGITATCVPNQVAVRPECPRLSGGICALRCETDKDCQGRLICCSNGCGMECVVPLTDFPIKAKPIAPVNGPFRRLITAVEKIPNTISSFLKPPPEPMISSEEIEEEVEVPMFVEKAGQCPSSTSESCKHATIACERDEDCGDYQKCCSTSCGKKCRDPIKATACIHLAMAIKRLPSGKLINGYIPKCELNGKFSPVQCDESECWCVDVNYGSEISGSRIELSMKRHDMCINLRLCATKCEGTCPHGFIMNQFGCPVEGCICKDICHGIGCINSADICQLVEPDCLTPPCLPVPRCLINPCPTGHPMTIPTGVTALCVRSEQCSDNYWCHKIGYSGLGFCCSGKQPEAIFDGQCPSRTPHKNSTCVSTCKSDEHCLTGKCCYDGCGLSCVETEFQPKTTLKPLIQKLIEKKIEFQPSLVAAHNKDHLSSLVAECPIMPSSNKNCTTLCSSDADCPGMKRCCRSGCSTLCTYFVRSTPCYQHSLTAETYSLRKVKKCDRAGNYERIQCDDNGCYCVNPIVGEEIPGTRKSLGKPNCSEIKICKNHNCKTICPYGYITDREGCQTCACANPCQEVKCPEGSMCVMSIVDCFQKENCNPQPRCVLSMCPTGEAAISPIGTAEVCSDNQECPKDYWCHSFGLSSGGICCPNPVRPKLKGHCPSVQPLLDRFHECRLECRTDEDCMRNRKCCFDGCGTMCLDFSNEIGSEEMEEESEENTENITSDIQPVTDFDKIGGCPHVTETNCPADGLADECVTDMNCAGVQKCCSDGCRKLCIYAERTTACLQLKGALQQIGQMDRVKCRPNGSFEHVQCSSKYCWCVDSNGLEIEGTRTSDDAEPNCEERRKCSTPVCSSSNDCKFGFKKDNNGCNTCECHSPCDSVTCPYASICIPISECTKEPCQEVPRCVINPCQSGEPLVDQSTFEAIICKDNRQCQASNNGKSYCNLFKGDEGYCCPGKEPKQHPGTCPRLFDSKPGNCLRNCNSDEQCAADEKCCSNGCGLSCQPAEFDTPVHSIVHIGECLPVKSLGAFCPQRNSYRSSESECKSDADCDKLSKCCSDGCSQRCVAPYITTQCIHSRLAAISLRELNTQAMLPECDSSGEFVSIQTHYGLKWCVDEQGNEIPGTKTVNLPNCHYPKSCPVRSCSKQCHFGFKTDNDGCIVCDCRDYCEFMECPAGTLCRMVDTVCITADCQPVPRCVPNICSSGEPLISRDSGTVAECSVQSDCPANFYCQKSGFIGKGFCCPGKQAQFATIQCPAIATSNSSVDGSACVVSCRRPSDCIQSICCFNGCGTSCQFHTGRSIAPMKSIRKMILSKPVPSISFAPVMESAPDITMPVKFVTQNLSEILTTPSPVPVFPSQVLKISTKVGTCPLLLLNPGCIEECNMDSDCPGFMKCCKASCASICSAAKSTTYCGHLLSSLSKENDRFEMPLLIQCSMDGTFRRHQCDARLQQCWCVEEYSGREIIGTRQASSLSLPDCSKPKICSSNCQDALALCPYGLRLDSDGCPQNGICICRNPCQDIKCSSPLSTCVLLKKECIGTHCPSVPTCIPNLCGLNSVITEEYGNPRTCQSESDCDHHDAQCIVESNGDEQISMCCQPISTTTELIIRKRLRKPTACTILRASIESLLKKGATTRLNKPACTDTGAFSTVQCDSQGFCWCVNSNNGHEIAGTRKLGINSEQQVCKIQHTCSKVCSEARCPFGLQYDHYGCPLPNCQCFSPCDQISCKDNEICLLKTRSIDFDKVFAIPSCQKSPCTDGQEPGLDFITRQRFSCSEKTTCPDGHYCTKHDSSSEGFCCPGTKTQIISTVQEKFGCTHGDPYSSSPDGTPLTCTVSANGCPSTHYCSTKAGLKEGICCVTKRYVCNLAHERGACSTSVERFFYSSSKQRCLPFEYGGCAGNLNNFASMIDCQQFCQGIGIDISSPYLDNDIDDESVVQSYQLGFTLLGPIATVDQRNAINAKLQRYLQDTFSISNGSLNDLEIANDKTVRFKLVDVKAREYAQLISEAISNGTLEFEVDSQKYQAEPQTLFAHQAGEVLPTNSTAKIVFWAVLLASTVFAIVVIVILCLAFVILYKSSAKETSSIRGSTPSNFVSNSIVAHRVNHKLSNPSQPHQTQRLRREMIFSREDLHRVHGHHIQNERPQSVIYY